MLIVFLLFHFMNFLDINFPKDIAYNAVGVPSFSTNIIQTSNGSEIHNVNWQNALHKYNITYGLKTFEQMKKVSDLFLQVKGRAHSFCFHYWFDYDAYDQELKKIDDKTFQFIKTYGYDLNKYERKITKLVKGMIAIGIGNISNHRITEVIYNDTADSIVNKKSATIDYNTGIVNFGTAPLTADQKLITNFAFDVPVRFDIDCLSIMVKGNDDFISENIYLIEVNS